MVVFSSNEINCDGYCGNNPIGSTDPTGLDYYEYQTLDNGYVNVVLVHGDRPVVQGVQPVTPTVTGNGTGTSEPGGNTTTTVVTPSGVIITGTSSVDIYNTSSGSDDSDERNHAEQQRQLNNELADFSKRILMGQTIHISKGQTMPINGEGPCHFMTDLGIAQSFASKTTNSSMVLNDDQMWELFNDTKLWNKSKNTPNGSDTAIITKALALLLPKSEFDKLTIRVVRREDGIAAIEKAKLEAFATIRAVQRADDKKNSGEVSHYQEGNAAGVFVWDPLSGSSDGGRVYLPDFTRYVIIQKRKD